MNNYIKYYKMDSIINEILTNNYFTPVTDKYKLETPNIELGTKISSNINSYISNTLNENYAEVVYKTKLDKANEKLTLDKNNENIKKILDFDYKNPENEDDSNYQKLLKAFELLSSEYKDLDQKSDYLIITNLKLNKLRKNDEEILKEKLEELKKELVSCIDTEQIKNSIVSSMKKFIQEYKKRDEHINSLFEQLFLSKLDINDKRTISSYILDNFDKSQ